MYDFGCVYRALWRLHVITPDFARYVQHCAAWSIMLISMKRPTTLVFFSICAVVDFVFGCIKWHSVVAGVVSIVCGLPLTLLLFLVFRARWTGNDDSAAPHS